MCFGGLVTVKHFHFGLFCHGLCISCLWLLWQITTNLVALNSRDVLSVGQARGSPSVSMGQNHGMLGLPLEAVGENPFLASASFCVVFLCWWPCHCSPRLSFSWVCGVKASSATLIRSLAIAFRACSDNLCHLKIHNLNHLSKDPFPDKLIFTGSRLEPDTFGDHFSALWSS